MEPIHILSLGAGVQSSTLALMAAAGEIGPMPAAAIFADTQAEPKIVYAWLDWLEKQLPFSVYRVSRGDLGADFIAALSTPGGRSGQPPFFVRSDRDQSTGVLWRECTSEYKLAPIRRKARELMEEAGTDRIVQMIGISIDEAHRMKDSGVKYVANVYPLVDHRISRRDCLKWMKDRGFPEPPKSACYFCPYHSDAFWLRMRLKQPDEFARAVTFERDVQSKQCTGQNGARIYGKIYLHRSAVPLEQAVFDPNEGQGELFGNECEGMCGV